VDKRGLEARLQSTFSPLPKHSKGRYEKVRKEGQGGEV
jgi:hypothetical protein